MFGVGVGSDASLMFCYAALSFPGLQLLCSGGNREGALGIPSVGCCQNVQVPSPVPVNALVVAVEAGRLITCVVTASSQVLLQPPIIVSCGVHAE